MDIRVAIPEGKYRPAAIPTVNNPRRRVQGPSQNVVPIKAKPRAVLEIVMALLWLKREDMNPDPIRVMKYPSEIIKNSAPASAWVRFRSVSILGTRGAGMMRPIKLRKKMDVRIRSGPN